MEGAAGGQRQSVGGCVGVLEVNIMGKGEKKKKRGKLT